jgi:hypothetical protein
MTEKTDDILMGFWRAGGEGPRRPRVVARSRGSLGVFQPAAKNRADERPLRERWTDRSTNTDGHDKDTHNTDKDTHVPYPYTYTYKYRTRIWVILYVYGYDTLSYIYTYTHKKQYSVQRTDR